MHSDCRSKTLLVILLSASLLATGCSPQWISAALADLPLLTQMALNIGTLVTTLQTGNQISSNDAAAIRNLSNETSKDLNLLRTLYDEYQANPGDASIQKIQSAITAMNQNLPSLLLAAHIGNPVVSARISAAVNLILTTVDGFAQLVPPAGGAPRSKLAAIRMGGKKASIPKADSLKNEWNHQVCGPSGKPPLDEAFAACNLK